MREAVSVCWVQVRTFLQLPVVNAVDSHTPATLARLVEGWTFHETLLEHGKQVHTCLHELRCGHGGQPRPTMLLTGSES